MPAAKKSPLKPTKTPAPRMALAEVMAALEQAGSAQTRKTYLRHGAPEPMFGVSFAELKTLMKRIRVDHELACLLWETGNFDARNLAFKIADPSKMSFADLDRWAEEPTAPMCSNYVAYLAVEGTHARALADAWLAAPAEAKRTLGWNLVGAMAMCEEATEDAWFVERLAEIGRTLHQSPNATRGAMNQTLIAIGCRSTDLRESAAAVAKRLGKVEVDHGDTACKTPDAGTSIEKAWAHSLTKGFSSPAAHERSRESMRTRC